MKSIIKIIGVLFILLIIGIIAVPFIFKDDIIDLLKQSTNENLEATVNFTDVDLSLLNSFPDLSVDIKELSVINKKPFEGDTLFYTKSLKLTLDLLSVITDKTTEVKRILINSPIMYLYIEKDGTTNYNITKKQKTKSQNKENAFAVKLKEYSISNGTIIFINKKNDIVITLKNVNHKGKGDFTQDDFLLNTNTTAEELTYEFMGIKYLNKVKAKLDMDLAVNLPKFKFEFKNNDLILNNLNIKFNGMIAMPKDDIDMNLTFQTQGSNFKDFISLLPAVYKNDFASIKSSGKMKIEGKVTGKLTDTKIPAFNINIDIKNGKIKYPDLPSSLNNVNLLCNITNNDGIKDHTIIDINKFNMKFGNEPFDAELLITNPVSSPNINTKIKTKINLANIKKALKLNNINTLQGMLNANFSAKGNIATMQNNYENINAVGNFHLSGFVYTAKDLPEKINIQDAALNFTPKNVKLVKLNLKIGESDIQANGTLRNFISYFLTKNVLHGDLNLTSNYFNFNPYITEEKKQTGKGDENKLTAVNIPENIDFNLNAKFKKILYDNLTINNTSGNIQVSKGKVLLNNLNMNLLNGKLIASGYYSKTLQKEKADIDFNLNIKNFNIKKLYDKFISIQTIAPIAKYIDGSFSSTLKLNSNLNNNLMPVWKSFFSKGILKIFTAEVKNFKPLEQLGSLLNLKEISNPKIQNLNPGFEIKNGRFFISPIQFRIANYNAVISGSNGIDKTIDYKLTLDIPAKKLKNQANNAIAALVGKNINLVNVSTIKVNAIIGGTIEKPVIKTSAGDVVKNVATDIVNKAEKKIKDEAKKKIDEAKAKAKAEAEKLKAEAKTKAEKLKKEAERKIKEEKRKLEEAAKKKKEELKKKLEEEAKKKLKNIFGGG